MCASAPRTATWGATGARRRVRSSACARSETRPPASSLGEPPLRGPAVDACAVSPPEDRPARSRGGGETLRVAEDLAIPLAEITLRTSRSSGPGGQHANVTASRVEASFDVLGSRSLSESQRSLLLARAGSRVVAVAQD